MSIIYIEENGQYSLDCTEAVWSTDRIHDYYQDPRHSYGKLGFLCDVDFVIENESSLLLVEYKNANIPEAAHPERFHPSSGNKLDSVAKKFFDSLPWLYLMGKDKIKKYIYVLEYPAGNSTSRLLVRNELKRRLPFELQANVTAAERKIIDEVRVVDIAEWNADIELGKYRFQTVTASST